MRESTLVKKFQAKFLADQPNDWQAYHALIAAQLRAGLTALEVGCGKGNIAPFPWEQYPEVELIGLDPDPAAQSNPCLDRFVQLDDAGVGRWPLADSSIDLALARYVLEHVTDADGFFDNLRRVLKPQGQFIFLTPNRYHPAVLVSRFLGYGLKRRLLRVTQAELDEKDVFPTVYALNSRRKLARLAQKHGLAIRQLQTREYQPIGYLAFAIGPYLLGYFYYAIVRRTGLERWLGSTIIGVLVKP